MAEGRGEPRQITQPPEGSSAQPQNEIWGSNSKCISNLTSSHLYHHPGPGHLHLSPGPLQSLPNWSSCLLTCLPTFFAPQAPLEAYHTTLIGKILQGLPITLRIHDQILTDSWLPLQLYPQQLGNWAPAVPSASPGKRFCLSLCFNLPWSSVWLSLGAQSRFLPPYQCGLPWQLFLNYKSKLSNYPYPDFFLHSTFCHLTLACIFVA